MNDNLNDVKTAKAPARGYHHGDLRAALVTAGLEIIEEVGLEAFSLRASARRAGVSPAAPSHHFRDARGLLTAIAALGFVELGDALERATGSDRRSTVVAHSHAYLAFALAKPGLFRLMWRRGALDMTNADYLAAAHRAFGISDRVVRGHSAEATDFADPALAPTLACWSMVHGFALLVIDGAFFTLRPAIPESFGTLLDMTLAHLDLRG